MAWSSADGKIRLAPKDDGSGIMVSAFQSREFGFGMASIISDKVLSKVNKKRSSKRFGTYFDKNAAIISQKGEVKEPLTSDPFIRLFEYGNSDGKEG